MELLCVCLQGDLKRLTLEDPEKYVVKNPQLPLCLHK